MPNITKDIFLKATDCLKRGWLILRDKANGVVNELSPDEKLRMEEGLEIGIRARNLYPQGRLISEKNIKKAAKLTRELISNDSVDVIFEATFQSGDMVAKADILKRDGHSWHLIEVKSGKEATDEYIADIAYTFSVLRGSGLNVSAASLMCVSGDYRLGMGDEALFSEFDVTKQVLETAEGFETNRDSICKNLTLKKAPKADFKLVCKGCGYFEDCVGKGIANPIFNLPRISLKLFDRLNADNIKSIEEIPASFDLTDNQEIVARSVRSGETFISGKLKTALETIVWPAYYLDFETIMTALPLFKNVAPYEQLLTQYSLHICSEPGKVVEHREYLAGHDKDYRRELAERLIEDLETKGSIIVYHTFEKTMISGLIKLFPDLKTQLTKIINRLVDLKAIINKHFYHPDFHGSYSIKVVLPVLVAEMSYKNLTIKNGGEAIAAFVDMIKGRYTKTAVNKIRKALLEYCALDTMAMVKLHEKLVEIAL